VKHIFCTHSLPLHTYSSSHHGATKYETRTATVVSSQPTGIDHFNYRHPFEFAISVSRRKIFRVWLKLLCRYSYRRCDNSAPIIHLISGSGVDVASFPTKLWFIRRHSRPKMGAHAKASTRTTYVCPERSIHHVENSKQHSYHRIHEQ
jgi:hypothetical protein